MSRIRPQRTLTYRQASRLLLLLMVFMASVGCSRRESTYPVSGRVVFSDETPVRTGVVEFSSVEGEHTAHGRIEDDGTFLLSTFREGDGAVAGDHEAIVVQLILTEHLPLEEHADHGDRVHPRFARYETSGLQFTVEPKGENVIDIRVERAE